MVYRSLYFCAKITFQLGNQYLFADLKTMFIDAADEASLELCYVGEILFVDASNVLFLDLVQVEKSWNQSKNIYIIRSEQKLEALIPHAFWISEDEQTLPWRTQITKSKTVKTWFETM